MSVRKKRRPKSRRTPRQQRSRETIGAIFEATARLLERTGPSELTTIGIAQLSGYGVATVYDYFPNKEAILVAMARHELEKTLRSVQKALSSDILDGAETTMRLAIRALIRGFGGRQKLRRILLETMIAQGYSIELSV